MLLLSDITPIEEGFLDEDGGHPVVTIPEELEAGDGLGGREGDTIGFIDV